MRYALEVERRGDGEVLRFADWGSGYDETRAVLRLAVNTSRDRITVCRVVDLADDGRVYAEFRYGAMTRGTSDAYAMYGTLNGTRYYFHGGESA